MTIQSECLTKYELEQVKIKQLNVFKMLEENDFDVCKCSAYNAYNNLCNSGSNHGSSLTIIVAGVTLALLISVML
jgi:hypothetical protein